MPVKGQSGEDDEEWGGGRQSSRTRRINRFENSPYYIQPLPADGSPIDDDNLLFTPPDNSHLLTVETTNLIESSTKSPVNRVKSPMRNVNNEAAVVEVVEEKQESSSPKERVKLVFWERMVEIQRPVKYALRGFGFLLNTGVGSNDFVNSDLFLCVPCASETDSYVERSFEYLNYAQIVVVENGINYVLGFRGVIKTT